MRWHGSPLIASAVSLAAVLASSAALAQSSAERATTPSDRESSGAGRTAPGSTERAPEGRHCAGEPVSKWVGDQLLGVQTNPLGVETTFRLGACFPLIRRPGVLFEQTQLQVGIVDILSPAYDHFGAFVQLTPLSLLVLRAEIAGVGTWVFPTDRAAYFPLDSYDADYEDELLTNERGESALGWTLAFTAILRLKVPIGPVALLAVDSFTFERWELGDAARFVVLRHDVVAAQGDWIGVNEALLLVEIPLSSRLALRVGAFDSLRWVPDADYVRNQLGGIATLVITQPTGALFEVQPLLRLGVHTHHAFREGELSLVGGVTAAYDFGAL